MFFSRAFQVDDKYIRILDKEYTNEEWDEYGEAEQDRATDALIDYQLIVTRAVLGELNALVEYEIKWVAKSIRRKMHGKSLGAEKKLSRDEACKIIEKYYQVKLGDLPGYAKIDEIRKVVNAYKHDDGYSGKYETLLFGSKEKRYNLDPDTAEKYLLAVKEFLTALPGEVLNLGEDVRSKN
jgi:hypothetical protein